MGKMDKELTALVLDGPNSPEDAAEEFYPEKDVDLDELAKLLGVTKEQLLQMVQESSDEQDPYED